MDNAALLIIDMQRSFCSSRDKKTILNVLIQIKKAKEENLPIFVLEYVNHGKTMVRVRNQLKGYKKVYYVKKDDDDGSQELIDCVKKHKLMIHRFIVCGVNISFCVALTTTSLVGKFRKKITVIKDACNCSGWQCNGDRETAFTGQHYTSVYQKREVTLV